jgi:anaerobic magnesium-protoporphyrin IX monomethyl ester cyclase
LKVDLVLINPNNRTPAPFAAIEPPLWAGLIAGYRIAQGDTVAIVDAEAEGLTVEQTAKRVNDLHPTETIIVVMGANPSVSSTPKMPVTEKLLKCLPGAKVTGLHPLAVNYPNTIKHSFEGSPSIPWALLPMGRYRAHNWHCLADISHRTPYAVTYTSLNCPFACHYCNVHTLYGNRKIQFRPLSDIAADFSTFARMGIKNIKIWDELFCLLPERVETICDSLIAEDYDFNIWAYARVDTVTTTVLKKMKKAGISWLCYGIESTNDKKSTRAPEAIKMTRAAGINIMGNFLFGLPGDTLDGMKRNLEYAMKENFEYVNFYVALPYPGSAWYDSLAVKFTDWITFGQFTPNICADPEVVKFRDYAFKTYFSRSEYLSMIKSKFGHEAENHIKEMIKWNIR